jgi:hypothetical protein
MQNLSIRITDHRTGFDQTLEIDTYGPEFIGNLTPAELAIAQDMPAANDAPANRPRFVDNNDGTVTDTTTRLMWSKATLCDKEITQHAAVKLCAELDLAGHADWRIPTRVELLTLVDDTRSKPAIDAAAFPDTRSDWYWTGSEYAAVSSYAWIVDFDGGNSSGCHRDYDDAFVRAVRSLPAGQ